MNKPYVKEYLNGVVQNPLIGVTQQSTQTEKQEGHLYRK